MRPPKHVQTAIMRFMFLSLIDYLGENPIGAAWPDNTTFGDKPNYLHLSPDLVVEIVSEHDRYSDITRDADILACGTQLVWIIDPQRDSIHVHTPNNPDGHTLNETEILKGEPLFPNWKLSAKPILGAGDSE